MEKDIEGKDRIHILRKTISWRNLIFFAIFIVSALIVVKRLPSTGFISLSLSALSSTV